MAAVWTVLVAGGAFSLLLGLVVDGGNAIDARLAAKRAAEQAARAGADAISSGSVRSGTDAINVTQAAARAQQILNQAGLEGTIHVVGTTVEVGVTDSSPTQFLGLIGVTSFAVHETGSATAITGPS